MWGLERSLDNLGEGGLVGPYIPLSRCRLRRGLHKFASDDEASQGRRLAAEAEERNTGDPFSASVSCGAMAEAMDSSGICPRTPQPKLTLDLWTGRKFFGKTEY